MQVVMNFGREGLSIPLPDELTVSVIRKKPMPLLSAPRAAVLAALKNPVASPPLAELARQARHACVLICDITRPVPNGLILPPLVSEMLGAGMRPENITILVATGLHRPNEGEELREIVGDDWVLNTVKAVNHFARRDEDHADLGRTSRGTPILLDKRFVEADLRIAVGLVEPHFMAGYSGGRKVITPGVCHHTTIRRLHTATFLEDGNAANCVIQGNPLHQEQIEIARQLGKVLAVNTVIDEERRMSLVNFGAIEESHGEAVAHTRPYAEVPVGRRFRTVLTSSAGYPLDKTFYQTVKGMVGAMDILEPGGDMFVVSACSEGLGSAEYHESQADLVRLGPEGFIEMIGPKDLAAVDEWETEMQVKAMRRGRIHLYSPGLKPEERKLTGVEVFEDVSTFVSALIRSAQAAPDKTLAAVPEGPYVIPVHRPA